MTPHDIELLEYIGISATYLNHKFGRKTVQRGSNYFKRKFVLSIGDIVASKDQVSMIISGEIAGSKSTPYQTTLKLSPFNNTLSITSSCSCPVDVDCKHGVALLLFFVHRLGEKGLKDNAETEAEEEVDSWLDFLEEEQDSWTPQTKQLTTTPKWSADKLHHVIYLLDNYTPTFRGDDKGLCVKAVKCRILKAGGYGTKLLRLRYSDISDDAISDSNTLYYNEIDQNILTALRGIASGEETTSHYYYRSDDLDYDRHFFLKGELGSILFQQLLQTQRVFWQDQKSRPLSNSGERELQLNWKEEEDQVFLDAFTEPAFQLLFHIDKLLYIDSKNHQAGYISHPSLNVQQILGLLKAPPIPKKKAIAASQRLLSLLPNAHIPLPASDVGKDLLEIDVTPTACLKIHTQNLNIHGEDKLVHFAKLSFAYDQVIYQAKTHYDLQQSVSFVEQDDKHYRLLRDTNLEAQFIQRLKGQGFSEFSEYQVCDFLMNYPSATESVMYWDAFLEYVIPELLDEGWKVDIDASFNLEIDAIDDWYAELETSDNGDWFEMTLGFELNGQPINMLPILVDLLARAESHESLHQELNERGYQLLQIEDNQWVKIPAQRILRIFDTIVELYHDDALNNEGQLEFSRYSGLYYGDLLNDPELDWKGAEELQNLTKKLGDFSGIETVSQAKGLNATLRDYQTEGVNWLQFLRDYDLNGILADDMGLGKTIQALASLLLEKESGRAKHPNLVIAPTSLMSNWRREIEKFAPSLSVLVLQGPERKQHFSEIPEYDVILSTYPLMTHDEAIFSNQEFHYLILDEAQAIKNARAQRTQIIYRLKAKHRLCLTGTPIENHLGELWSMYHFLMPGYLGSQQYFHRLFRTPIERHGDAIRAQQLRKRVEPFMLRRSKDIVAADLPKKTEMIQTVTLMGRQRDLYETVRLAMDKKVRAEIKKKGLAGSQLMILDALLKLRQVCCDPRLVKLNKAKNVKESAKLTLLMEMLPEMVEEGRKVLIFSQFTSMLSLIEPELARKKIKYSKLTGQTRKREAAIDAFQLGDAKVFLISLKAGGMGLNLTAADTVIHYDPWWNPAVERQATDRAYRIGQDKPVFVYKLITENTVEEKIIVLQEKKQALADNIYSATSDKKGVSFGQSDLMDLLQPIS
jgi:superfamily II DNA or RNA helicase